MPNYREARRTPALTMTGRWLERKNIGQVITPICERTTILPRAMRVWAAGHGAAANCARRGTGIRRALTSGPHGLAAASLADTTRPMPSAPPALSMSARPSCPEAKRKKHPPERLVPRPELTFDFHGDDFEGRIAQILRQVLQWREREHLAGLAHGDLSAAIGISELQLGIREKHIDTARMPVHYSRIPGFIPDAQHAYLVIL